MPSYIPNVLIIGRGPISLYLINMLKTLTTYDHCDGVDRATRSLPDTALAKTYDAVIIAEQPWRILSETLPALLAPSRFRQSPIFISANGYWCDDLKKVSAKLGAISVTAKVTISPTGAVEAEPVGAGILIGTDARASRAELATLAMRTGVPAVVANTVEQAVFSKCLVNSPLTLNYATHEGSLAHILEDNKVLYSEAVQITELTKLATAAGIDLVPTPGFDLGELTRLALAIASIGCSAELTEAQVEVAMFRELLRTWRGSRPPSIGERVRRRDAKARNSLVWLWGRLSVKATALGLSMPESNSLYRRAIARLGGEE